MHRAPEEKQTAAFPPGNCTRPGNAPFFRIKGRTIHAGKLAGKNNPLKPRDKRKTVPSQHFPVLSDHHTHLVRMPCTVPCHSSSAAAVTSGFHASRA
eukprot:1158491-Pelagomonas_calceolata.AAC.3